MSGARIMAFLGKGGAGKTMMSALTARLLIPRAKRLLMIDADPALGLTHALGAQFKLTLGEARERVIREAKKGAGEDRAGMSNLLDYLLLEALVELPGYSLLVMGCGEGPGCYCPVNTLLRESIEELAVNFDYIVIDAEAGMEQVSRQLTRRVEHPLIVSDRSFRGVSAARAIAEVLEKTQGPRPRGVIVNRAEALDRELEERIKDAGLPSLGVIPEDETIARFDREGRPLLELPDDSPALAAAGELLTRAGVI